MSQFVETTTRTITEKRIKTMVDEFGPGCTQMSVVPADNNTEVELVIGAEYENAYCYYFSKKTLGELIEELKEIHDAMED